MKNVLKPNTDIKTHSSETNDMNTLTYLKEATMLSTYFNMALITTAY